MRPRRSIAAIGAAVVTLVVACALLLASTGAWAQAARESAVKAAFLYKFGAFVTWPASTFTRADQPLVIGVSGDEAIAQDLEQLTAGRTVEGRPVQVRRIPDAGPVAGVNILFLAPRRETRLKDAIDGAAGGVLVVTDQPEGIRHGAVINFTAEGGRIRFSASLAAAEARNLRLSSRLLEVAQAVEGRAR
jgi:hypothetical protein